MTEPTHVDLAILAAGFHGSRRRFMAAPPESAEPFHAIFESLAWVGSIGDRLNEKRQAVPPVLEGLYYVRNLVIHQGADVLRWVLFPGGELGRLVLGRSSLGSISRHAWLWPPRTQMPEPRSLRGAAKYDSHVAGREVAVVLETLAAALEKLFEGGA